MLSKDQADSASAALLAPAQSTAIDPALVRTPLPEQKAALMAVMTHWALIAWMAAGLTCSAILFYRASAAAIPVAVVGLVGFVVLRRILLRRHLAKRTASPT